MKVGDTSLGRYPLTVFYDGECPVCAREIALLKRLNRKGRLRFVDFADSAYDPRQTGFDRETLGQVIHAHWADGSVVRGVEVIRAVWTALGFGFIAGLSRLPGIGSLMVRGYAWFARNRLRMTGRTPPGHDTSDTRVGEKG